MKTNLDLELSCLNLCLELFARITHSEFLRLVDCSGTPSFYSRTDPKFLNWHSEQTLFRARAQKGRGKTGFHNNTPCAKETHLSTLLTLW